MVDKKNTPSSMEEQKRTKEAESCPILVQPTAKNPDPHDLFIDEVQGHNRRIRKLVSFTHSSTRAAFVMLLGAIVALIIANTDAHEGFLEFWHVNVVVGVGDLIGEMSLAHMINDIFMAVFFLLVGLEIKYEMTVGELTNIRQAALPILGAIGGVAAPIVIYLIFNVPFPQSAGGWGVPTATDIAFALGILALLGSRVPGGLRVFLSTLAVADDIIAILVIAIFYGETPDLAWLVCALVIFIALVMMNRMHVFSLVPYILVGAVLWFCVYMSGIHATIAGVLLAFTIPSGSRVKLNNFLKWSDDRVKLADAFYEEGTPIIKQKKYISAISSLSSVSKETIPPATRLEHKLYPWVYFAILPLFALTNADVSLAGAPITETFLSPVFLGVFFGLVIGKPLGIMAMSFLCVKLRIATLPTNVNWMHMLGASILGGVGFTMAIFVANLAYASPALIAQAKLAILIASLFAGVIGFVFLFLQAKSAEKEGIDYITLKTERETVSHDEAERVDDAARVLAELEDEELSRELDRAAEDAIGMSEFVIRQNKR